MDADSAEIARLESSLNDRDPAVRAQALQELAGLAERGAVAVAAETDVVNMHCHTFFSFNAYGHSPTSLAWLAKRRGFRAVGIVDFDVLDGVEEFLQACETVGVRGSAGIETRVYVAELAQREINSPGEPGVAYHMGIGFATGRVPDDVQRILQDLRERAARRNREMVERINRYLEPVGIDYERDVLPLAPAGNATERHLLAAYLRAAEESQPDAAAFWAEKLRVDPAQVRSLGQDRAALASLIRAKLMKRGGAGYVAAEAGSFPTVADYHRLIVACGALPCLAWLDGTSPGEEASHELVDFWLSRGVVALNIIPDRNWNIADAGLRRLKAGKLHEIVHIAEERALPLIVGTEMNSPGQRLVDDFDAPELAPLRRAFLDGAHFVYGHTVLQRALGLGYGSPWAAAHLPSRRERCEFYTRVGYLVAPGPAGRAALAALGAEMGPGEIVARLSRE